jgi:hypothetical protein
MSAILDAALDFAAHDIPVFPCRNSPRDHERHKKPMTQSGYMDATCDPSVVRKWWTQFPNALIGMPTGWITGISVLDIDCKHGKNGFTYMGSRNWQSRTPVVARTGTGGAHLYFKHDNIRCTTDEIASGVDTRGDGGYVIVPPSEGYRWENGHDLTSLPPWPDDLRPPERETGKPGEPQADPSLVAAALVAIPNDDCGWECWNRIGMATWAATGGAEEGLAAFDMWSSKSKKHDQRATRERWEHYFESPPSRIGAGTLFFMAQQNNPNWRPRDQKGSGDAAIDAEVARLAKLSAAQYDRVRMDAAKKLGLRSATLDKLVIGERAKRAQAQQVQQQGKGVGLEDNVALTFAEQHTDDYRFVAKSSQWLRWAATRWESEDTLAAFDASRKLCRDAGDADAKTVAAVVALARSDRRIAATMGQWDAEPAIINTPTKEST